MLFEYVILPGWWLGSGNLARNSFRYIAGRVETEPPRLYHETIGLQPFEIAPWIIESKKTLIIFLFRVAIRRTALEILVIE